ncbi:MAG: M55 family metallopeptidase [Gammaproteobacteria bacterium]|nr:M55 family metallopeptidase [Gammaproteobacteria bacterium]
MKQLFISADIEGVAGVVTRTEAHGDKRDYDKARKWMTDEVIAACNAARDSGIERVVIADSHGDGDNLLLDNLPDYVEVVRSWPRELLMMQGIEQGPFVGAALIGYHAGSRAESGIMAHTFTGDIQELCLNGEAMSETTFNAAVAGHFEVPVIMASGDDVYTTHVNDVLPEVKTATVKWAHGTLSARTLTPARACQQVADSLAEALGQKEEFELYRIDGPIQMEIELTNRVKAEILSYVPTVERVGSHRIMLEVEDIVSASRFLNFYFYVNTGNS